MEPDNGRIGAADRASRASTKPASGLGHSATIPCAWTKTLDALHAAMMILDDIDYRQPPFDQHPHLDRFSCVVEFGLAQLYQAVGTASCEQAESSE